MPTSKQVRARQNRQKERIAASHVERRRRNRRNRIIGGIVGALLVISAIFGAVVLLNRDSNNVAITPPTTTPTTVRATPTKCVGLKDQLPKGAPAMPITAGTAPTKLVKRDIVVGTGAVVPQGAKKVTVNYVGVACSTGKIFDSSYKAGGKPFDADLSGGVIAGWQQGVPGMKVGGVRILEIPPDLAYGAQGAGQSIPPNEPLYFLVKVEKV